MDNLGVQQDPWVHPHLCCILSGAASTSAASVSAPSAVTTGAPDPGAEGVVFLAAPRRPGLLRRVIPNYGLVCTGLYDHPRTVLLTSLSNRLKFYVHWRLRRAE
eukprot:2325345-Pyramimonas_sp.AAC.1